MYNVYVYENLKEAGLIWEHFCIEDEGSGFYYAIKSEHNFLDFLAMPKSKATSI